MNKTSPQRGIWWSVVLLMVIALSAAASWHFFERSSRPQVAREHTAESPLDNSPRPQGEGVPHDGMSQSPSSPVEIVSAANPNKKSDDGWPSIAEAAHEGDPAKVRQLLEAGADADAVGPGGWNALLQAAGNGYPEVVQILVDAGADIYAEDDLGRTALDIAIARGHNKTAIFLREMGLAQLSEDDKDFLRLICGGNLDAVRGALDRGVDLEMRAYQARTPLFFALVGDTEHRYYVYSSRIHSAMVELLLDYGADVHALDAAGDTPLMVFKKQRGNPLVVEKLLAAGAKIDVRSGPNRSSLLHMNCGPEEARLYIEYGLSPHTTDEKGRTPIEVHIRRLNLKTVQVLFDAGATVPENAASLLPPNPQGGGEFNDKKRVRRQEMIDFLARKAELSSHP